jgi:putative FmdB family regulatory protein
LGVPTYEYKCTSCENRYETKEGFDAPSRQACPKCGAIAKRILFAPPIVFKGSGFYITDSRKGSSVTVGDTLGNMAPSTADGDSSSTKSEPAPAAESKPAPAASSSSDA